MSPRDLVRRYPATTIFLLAAVARLLFVLVRGPTVSPDTADYARLAENMAQHGRFSLDSVAPFAPTIRRAPGYPMFLAAVGSVGMGSPMAIAAVQAFLNALVAAFVYVIGRRLFTHRAAYIIGTVYAVHPGAIATSASLLTETLFTVLMVSAVCLLIDITHRSRPAWALAAGILFGCASLTRSYAVLMSFMLFLSILWVARGIGSRGYIFAAVFLLAFVGTIAPWIVRSSRVANSFVLVQGAGSVNYYIPTLSNMDQRHVDFSVGPDLGNVGDGAAGQARADRIVMDSAIANIKRDPTAYVKSRLRAYPHLFLTTFDNFTGFNQSISASIANGDWYRLAVKLFLMIVFSCVPMLLALIALRSMLHDRLLLMLGIPWLFTLAFHVPAFIEYRFWIPVVPLLLLSAAAALPGSITSDHRRRMIDRAATNASSWGS